MKAGMSRARQRAGRPGPEIFDPGFQNPGFFDPEKNFILNPEPGPDLKFSRPEAWIFKFSNRKPVWNPEKPRPFAEPWGWA